MTVHSHLRAFLRGEAEASLEISYRISPVRAKVTFGFNQTSGVAHHLETVFSILDGDRIRYAARWICGADCTDAVLSVAPTARGVCMKCSDFVDGPTVYRMFDADGTLLYVGSTVARRQRMRSHEQHALWWPLVAATRYEDFATEREARLAEILAIQSEQPLHNVQARVPA